MTALDSLFVRIIFYWEPSRLIETGQSEVRPLASSNPIRSDFKNYFITSVGTNDILRCKVYFYGKCLPSHAVLPTLGRQSVLERDTYPCLFRIRAVLQIRQAHKSKYVIQPLEFLLQHQLFDCCSIISASADMTQAKLRNVSLTSVHSKGPGFVSLWSTKCKETGTRHSGFPTETGSLI